MTSTPLYTCASDLLNDIYLKRISVKSALYNKDPPPPPHLMKKLLPLLLSVDTWTPFLEKRLKSLMPNGKRGIQSSTPPTDDDPKKTNSNRPSAQYWPAQVMLFAHELWVRKAKGLERAGGRLLTALRALESPGLLEAVERERARVGVRADGRGMKRKADAVDGPGNGDDELDEAAPSRRLPRYGRVNLLAADTTVPSVLQALHDSGHTDFVLDDTLPDVLVGPVGTDLHDHPTVVSGQLILQDKAATLAVRALAAPPGAVAMDATAAPGNKTVQLAGAVGPSGTVHAFDRDRSRYELLNRMLARGHASAIVQARHADFLRVRPDDERYANVTHILVDPSCSGSGMPDVAAAKEMDAERLDKLVRFQVRMVRHALSFPAVQRVVYSTCSVNVEENEGVLRRLFRDREVAESFHVVQALPAEVADAFAPGVRLPNFASASKMVVRTTVADHRTIGFFVSAIARRKAKSTSASPAKKDK